MYTCECGTFHINVAHVCILIEGEIQFISIFLSGLTNMEMNGDKDFYELKEILEGHKKLFYIFPGMLTSSHAILLHTQPEFVSYTIPQYAFLCKVYFALFLSFRYPLFGIALINFFIVGCCIVDTL